MRVPRVACKSEFVLSCACSNVKDVGSHKYGDFRNRKCLAWKTNHFLGKPRKFARFYLSIIYAIAGHEHSIHVQSTHEKILQVHQTLIRSQAKDLVKIFFFRYTIMQNASKQSALLDKIRCLAKSKFPFITKQNLSNYP